MEPMRIKVCQPFRRTEKTSDASCHAHASQHASQLASQLARIPALARTNPAPTHEAAEAPEGSGKADLRVHLDDDLLRGYHVQALEAAGLSNWAVQDGEEGLGGGQEWKDRRGNGWGERRGRMRKEDLGR